MTPDEESLQLQKERMKALREGRYFIVDPEDARDLIEHLATGDPPDQRLASQPADHQVGVRISATTQS